MVTYKRKKKKKEKQKRTKKKNKNVFSTHEASFQGKHVFPTFRIYLSPLQLRKETAEPVTSLMKKTKREKKEKTLK
jgi:hypothetical protein